jgi:hypothetical protein
MGGHEWRFSDKRGHLVRHHVMPARLSPKFFEDVFEITQCLVTRWIAAKHRLWTVLASADRAHARPSLHLRGAGGLSLRAHIYGCDLSPPKFRGNTSIFCRHP